MNKKWWLVAVNIVAGEFSYDDLGLMRAENREQASLAADALLESENSGRELWFLHDHRQEQLKVWMLTGITDSEADVLRRTAMINEIPESVYAELQGL